MQVRAPTHKMLLAGFHVTIPTSSCNLAVNQVDETMSLRQTNPEVRKASQTLSPTNPDVDKPLDDKLKQSGRLLLFHEIPHWQKDNEYIQSGYRPSSGSAWVSFASICRLHNQTVNIYSHLIGAVAFVALPYYFYCNDFQKFPEARGEDLLVVSIYCLGVATCFAFSATFHILWNHSCAVSRFCNKLDYLGILVLMWGAGIPTIYYGFPCDPHLRLTYWGTTSFTALCCTFLTLSPRFGSPQFRHWRATLYAGFGLSSILFIVHGLILYGWEVQKNRMSLVWMGWMATANLLGAATYAARIPERWAPFTFDTWGASHQVLHVAVMIAAWLHFHGLMQTFRLSRDTSDLCKPSID
ncbi:hypothetical protein Q7P37_009283 [Cladosporium fusiforme]